MNGFFVGAVVLDSADKNALADFYTKLLDGKMIESNEHYIRIKLPSRLRLTFQNAEMSAYLAGRSRKTATDGTFGHCGGQSRRGGSHCRKTWGQKASAQFVPGMITMKDPAGHPFCLIPLPKE